MSGRRTVLSAVRHLDGPTVRDALLHEHFVSSAFRGVLGELRMPVGRERVRTAVLACPPHELHDLPLELFGAILHSR